MSSPEKNRDSGINKKLVFSNMNTPQPRILLESNEMDEEVSVSPFCLRNSMEFHKDNKENLTFYSLACKSEELIELSALSLEKPITLSKSDRIEEEAQQPSHTTIEKKFYSPMRSISFEENDDFLMRELPKHNNPGKHYQFKEAKKQNNWICDDGLLDTHENNMNPDIPTISCYTLKQLINKEILQEKEIIIIDCRYVYEFDGGHIDSALNVTDPSMIEDLFFKENPNLKPNEQYIIVFHCEFSQKRGPKMYRFFRKKDREINEEKYPFLSYPHIYLLDGGYNKFVKYHPTLCSNNGNYISMFDKSFKEECVQATSDYNRVWKKKKKEQINPLNLLRKHSF